MMAYQKLHNTLEGGFNSCELNYVTRANNTEADELANIGSTRGPVPPDVFLESISQRSIKTNAVAPEVVAEDDDTRTSTGGGCKPSRRHKQPSSGRCRASCTRRPILGKIVP